MHTHIHTYKDEQGNCSLLNHFERPILDQGQLAYSILRAAAATTAASLLASAEAAGSAKTQHP